MRDWGTGKAGSLAYVVVLRLGVVSQDCASASFNGCTLCGFMAAGRWGPGSIRILTSDLLGVQVPYGPPHGHLVFGWTFLQFRPYIKG